MKALLPSVTLFIFLQAASFAQTTAVQMREKEVFKNDDGCSSV